MKQSEKIRQSYQQQQQQKLYKIQIFLVWFFFQKKKGRLQRFFDCVCLSANENIDFHSSEFFTGSNQKRMNSFIEIRQDLLVWSGSFSYGEWEKSDIFSVLQFFGIGFCSVIVVT